MARRVSVCEHRHSCDPPVLINGVYVGDSAKGPTRIVGEAPDIVYDVDHPTLGAVYLPAAQSGGPIGLRQLVIRGAGATEAPTIDSIVVQAALTAL